MSTDKNRMRHKPPQRRMGPGGGPMGGFGMPGQKAKNFKASLKRLLKYLKPHRLNLIVVLIFAALSTGVMVYSPNITRKAMNKLQNGYMAKVMLQKMTEAQKQSIKESGSIQEKAVKAIEQQLSDAQKKIDEQLNAEMQKKPERSGGVQEDQAPLKAMQDFMKLPAIDNISDSQQKADTTLKVLDSLSKMPAPQQDNQKSQQMSPAVMGAMADLLKLPSISNIKDIETKKETAVKLLEILGKMPAPGPDSAKTEKPGTNTADSKKEMTPQAMKEYKDFLSMPLLDKEKDAVKRAEICRTIINLAKQSQGNGQNGLQFTSGSTSIKLTDAQINGTIENIKETNGKIDITYIGEIAILLIALYLISSLFSLIMGLVMSGVAQKTTRDLRTEVNRKLDTLPLKYYDMHAHGDILSRVTNDVDTISQTLQQSLMQIIQSLLQILGYTIMMLTISPLLTLIVLATMPLYVLATAMIAKQSQKYFAAQQKELGELSGHVEEMYSGHKVVRAFGKEADSIRQFEDINGKLYTAGWKAQFVSGILFPVMNFVSNIGYVMICIVGGIWMTKQKLQIGDITAFIQYSRSFTMPIVQTANIANVIQSTVACAERIFEVLDEQEEIPERADATCIETPKGEVSFKNVKFSYKENEPLIEDMTIDVKRGHTIAIVGPTGAGKTTLVNLLMRFYEINGGKISIDNVDVRDMKRADLRGMIGMVLQDTWLFNGTIKENIAYGRDGAAEEDIIQAAKAAHAHHFIKTLPQGYNTVLNEEATNISQGQKQLLTIARAILADPAILILDEATSSVDTRTELLIQKAMANLMKDRTSFVIAHRLSTIRDAELILVMNKGNVIEQGNHKELLAQGGFYADLYNSQFTGANLEDKAV